MRNVLFLCTGNSARSIVAEVLFNSLSGADCLAFSAGSQPTGVVNPGAKHVLRAHGHAVEGLRSKSWDEFAGAAAPAMDTVVTVCDNAAGESCPVWNGAPQRLHWGLPDPAAVADDAAREQAFEATYQALQQRISALLQAGEERPAS